MFLLDIFLTFNKGLVDEKLNQILDRREITKRYLMGWFIIDLIAIFPFELILCQGYAKNVVRVVRLGRIMRLLRYLKLMRLMKLQKRSDFNLFAKF